MILFFLSSTKYINAQTTFQCSYGLLNNPNLHGCSIKQMDDGGYAILAEYKNNNNDGDFWLIRINSVGDTLWTMVYGRSFEDVPVAFQKTFDGGFIMCGYSHDSLLGDYDISLIKANENGDTVWTRSFGGPLNEYANAILQTNDSGFILVGRTNSFGAGLYDIYLIKTNSTGEILWTKTFGGSGMEYGNSICILNDGGYIIAGTTRSFGFPPEDIYLIRTDQNGDTLLTQTIGSTADDWSRSVVQTSDSEIVIVGGTSGFGLGGGNIFLVKTNLNGGIIWSKTYSYANYVGECITNTLNNELIITGGDLGAALIKTNENGDTLWTWEYGGSTGDYGFSVCETNDNGYIITGRTRISMSTFATCIIKTDVNGNSGCFQEKRMIDVSPQIPLVTKPHTIVSFGGNESVHQIFQTQLVEEYSKKCLSTEVNGNTFGNILSLSPNPFTSQFLIKGTTHQGLVQIFDLAGKEVKHVKAIKDETQINCEDLNGGFYFVKYIEKKENVLFNFKVFKN
jgi:hypothetical protein